MLYGIKHYFSVADYLPRRNLTTMRASSSRHVRTAFQQAASYFGHDNVISILR
jgi:hypothetical protein